MARRQYGTACRRAGEQLRPGLPALAAMFFVPPFAAPRGFSFGNTAFVQRVTFYWPGIVVPDALIGMHIARAVHPSATPRRVVDEHRMRAPIEAAHAPAPRPEKRPDRHAETKVDRATHHESGPGREEHDSGVISRDHDKIGPNGSDGDVGPGAHHDLRA